MNDVLRTRIEEILREPVRDVALVSDGFAGTRRTWRVVTVSDRPVAVKEIRYRVPQTLGDHDACATEWALLTTLAEAGASVLRPIAVDLENGLILTEWLDAETFDDLCQRDAANAARRAPDGILAFGFIERVLDARIAEVEPYAFRQDYDAFLGTDFDAILVDAKRGYDTLVDELGGAEDPAEIPMWDALRDMILAAEPTFGPLDYNARNVLVHATGFRFLDFSTVGWDWPERRIVQYFTGLGARDLDATFVSALTSETIEAVRSELFFSPEALEAHHFVFFCLILERLSRHGVEMPADAPAEDRPLWRNRRRRYDDAAATLADGGLLDFGPTASLRARIRRLREG